MRQLTLKNVPEIYFLEVRQTQLQLSKMLLDSKKISKIISRNKLCLGTLKTILATDEIKQKIIECLKKKIKEGFQEEKEKDFIKQFIIRNVPEIVFVEIEKLKIEILEELGENSSITKNKICLCVFNLILENDCMRKFINSKIIEYIN